MRTRRVRGPSAALEPEAPGPTWYDWVTAGLLTPALWASTSTWIPAVGWVSLVLGTAAGRHWTQRGWHWRPAGGWRGHMLGLVLLVLALLLASWMLGALAAWPCEVRDWTWLLVLALVGVVAAVAVRARPWIRAVLLLWVLAAWAWGVRLETLCWDGSRAADGARSPTDGVTEAISAAAIETAIRAEEALTHDPDADLVSEATAGTATERLSVDDALRDPDAFFGECGRPVYLSGDVLFARSSAELDASAAPHLRKLARLVNLEKQGRFIVEGHTDPSGGDRINLPLSAKRAQAVALWLQSEGGVPGERLETVALGSTRGVTDDLRLQRLNRRVEVALLCAP